jgi:hypothetical protein
MDYHKCIEILSNRGSVDANSNVESCPCALDPTRPKSDFCQVCSTDQFQVSSDLVNSSNISLIDLIFQIQQKRIKVRFRELESSNL